MSCVTLIPGYAQAAIEAPRGKPGPTAQVKANITQEEFFELCFGDVEQS